MTSPLIATERVSRVHAKGRCTALSNVTIEIERGEYVVIMGPSGSGKSTLLHLLCGLDRPSSGRVLFEGCQPRGDADWTRLRATRIGFVFQAFNLLPTLTSRQNVEIPMFGVVKSAAQRRHRAEELLELVGLRERAEHRPAELSGGEKQRVAIARSMANQPDVILADELTGNLDSHAAEEVLDLLEEIRRERSGSLVIVTHDESIASRAGRVCRLRDGSVVSDEPALGKAQCVSGR